MGLGPISDRPNKLTSPHADNYEMSIDDRHQYVGEDARFVVWHDKDRKPYAVSLPGGFAGPIFPTFTDPFVRIASYRTES